MTVFNHGGTDLNINLKCQLDSLVGAKFRKYVGHSAHVTNVRFSHDMMRVISVGGGDHAIFQWRYLPDGSHDDGDEADGGAYLESNSDDSDSEASDADELDSDIENVSQKTNMDCFRHAILSLILVNYQNLFYRSSHEKTVFSFCLLKSFLAQKIRVKLPQ